MTLSEHLAKIAQKIDFSKTNGEDVKKESSEGGDKDENPKDTSVQSSLWPWDNVRNSLRFLFASNILWNNEFIYLLYFLHK